MGEFVWPPVMANGGVPTFPLSAPDGSSSNPSFAFTSQTNSGLYATSGAVNLGVGGNLMLKATSTTLGFYGSSGAAQSPAYTFTNNSTLRTYDVTVVTVQQVANVLATLMAYLKSIGLTA